MENVQKLTDLYSQIASKENLYRSAHRAALGRRYRDSAADFKFHLEEEVETLHGELTGKTYRHGKYRMFTIYDPKERNIAAAPFRDRVVHHAVHDVIEPFIDKTFIYDSYACRKDKGTHKAVDRAQSFLRANRFCLHGDVKKYFPSIDHGRLKEMLAKRIADKDLLWLVNGIIDSARQIMGDDKQRVGHCDASLAKQHACQAVRQSKEKVCFGVLQSSCSDEGKGLPIGNLTSQFFANLYLNELDYFVKFDLRRRYYLRYMDDFLVFANCKEELLEIKIKIRDFLKNKLALDLHEGKSQVYKTKNGVKFLGFRIFNVYRRLASDNVRRFKKRIKGLMLQAKHDSCHGDSAAVLPASPTGRRQHDARKAISDMRRLFPAGIRYDKEKIRNSVRCWTAHSFYANTQGLRLNMFNSFAEKDECFGVLLREVLLPPKCSIPHLFHCLPAGRGGMERVSRS